MNKIILKPLKWRLFYGVIVSLIGLYFNYNVFTNKELTSDIDFIIITITLINLGISILGVYWIITSYSKIEITKDYLKYFSIKYSTEIKWKEINDIHIRFEGRNSILSGSIDTSILLMIVQGILSLVFFGYRKTGKLIISISTKIDEKFKIHNIPTEEIKEIINKVSNISNNSFVFSDSTTEKQMDDFQFWNWTFKLD